MYFTGTLRHKQSCTLAGVQLPNGEHWSASIDYPHEYIRYHAGIEGELHPTTQHAIETLDQLRYSIGERIEMSDTESCTLGKILFLHSLVLLYYVIEAEQIIRRDCLLQGNVEDLWQKEITGNVENLVREIQEWHA